MPKPEDSSPSPHSSERYLWWFSRHEMFHLFVPSILVGSLFDSISFRDRIQVEITIAYTLLWVGIVALEFALLPNIARERLEASLFSDYLGHLYQDECSRADELAHDVLSSWKRGTA